MNKPKFKTRFALIVMVPAGLLSNTGPATVYFGCESWHTAEILLQQWIQDVTERLGLQVPADLNRKEIVRWFFAEGHGSYKITPLEAIENQPNLFDAYHQVVDRLFTPPA